MADTRIQGAVSVIGEIQSKQADTLMETSGEVGCCLSEGEFDFHSLRKSVVQGLQSLGVPAELCAAYVGQEPDDEHHAAYSRASMTKELLDEVKKLNW